MIKSDLLKEAIADANAVRETALANAKIALEEAFTPRIQSMLSAKLAEELEEEEEEMDMAAAMGDEMGMDAEMEAPESVGVGIDMDGDGSYDIEGEVGTEIESDEEMTDEMPGEEMPEDELDLESIIRELEGMDAEEEIETEMRAEGRGKSKAKMAETEMEMPEEEDMLGEDIDSIIEAILTEEEAEEDEVEEVKAELEEAYSTINKLRSVLQEVNLLNAKLLYTNKLFRNFELNETQKMKVIDNFDRAVNTREVKLVFTTLAESFKRPAKKQMVKENKSFASKTTGTTKPSKEIITEGNELVNRMKKLAGLL
jgi:hypothetical protein